MSNFSKVFTIIDIGSSKIYCAVIRVSVSNFVVLSEYKCRTLGFSNGYVTDMKNFTSCIQNVISKSENESNHIIDEIILVLSGKCFSSSFFNVNLLMKNNSITEAHIQKMMDKIKNSHTECWSIYSEALFYELDNNDMKVNDPIGMSCESVMAKIHNIKVKISPIKNIIACLNSINIQVSDLLFSPNIIKYAYSAASDYSSYIAIDIGHENIKVSKFMKNKLHEQFCLPLGGMYITQEIAGVHGISKTQAERLKILYGSSTIHPDDEEDLINVVSTNNETISIPKSKINKIILNYIKAIAGLIKRSTQIDDVEAIFIFGGVSALSGLKEKLSDLFMKNVMKVNFNYLLKNQHTQNAKSQKLSKNSKKSRAGKEKKDFSAYVEDAMNENKLIDMNGIGYMNSPNDVDMKMGMKGSVGNKFKDFKGYESQKNNLDMNNNPIIIGSVLYVQRKLYQNNQSIRHNSKKNKLVSQFFDWIKEIFSI